MALPSQTRREILKKAERPRRTARLSRTFRMLLAAVAGIAVVLIAIRMFAWPGREETQGTARSKLPAAGPAVLGQARHRQQSVTAVAPEVAQGPLAESAPAPLLEPAIFPESPPQVESAAFSTAVATETGQATPVPLWLPDSPSARKVQEAMALIEANWPVEARRALSALLQGDLASGDEEFVRDALSTLNRRLVFSPEVVPGDAFSKAYMVGSGEALSTIVKAQKLQVDWRFILRVNRLDSERYLRQGQRLKLVSGPFDAVVDKSAFRLDLYLGDGPDRVYVASFPIGLGEFDSTPVGRFQVRAGSRTMNPAWSNPRTGQRFEPGDPANPIGEHWIGLQGIDDASRGMAGYGIHGTIDPASIGHQKSMGCIRMLPDDVALVYEVLTDGSPVEIRP